MRTSRNRENVAWLTDRPFAHRGLHDLKKDAPENTLPAFEAAIEGNFGIELDVQLSADGEVVVFHDDTLERAAGVKEAISNLEYGALRQYGLFGTGHRAPLLVEGLSSIAGRVPVMIEIKNYGVVGELEERAASIIEGYTGPVCVISFNPYVLGYFAQRAPNVLRGQLGGRVGNYMKDVDTRHRIEHLGLNSVSAPDFVSYELKNLPNDAVASWRKAGGQLFVWTVRSQADRARALEAADNYVFENEGSGDG